MPAPTLARIRRSAAQVMEDAFAEQQAAGRFTDMAREIEETVAECLAYSENTWEVWKQMFKTICAQVEQRQPVDWQGNGEHLRDLFDSGLDTLRTLRRWATVAEGAGQQVRNQSELDEAIALMERRRAEVFDTWPWPMTAEEWAEVDAEIERGDGDWLPLDEAFAEIAGMTKEAWLAKVEARRVPFSSPSAS